MAEKEFYQLGIKEALDSLKTSAGGLSGAEAKEHYGTLWGDLKVTWQKK